MVHTLAPFHPTAAGALMLGQGGACRKVAFLCFSRIGLKGQTKPWGSVALLPVAVCCSGLEKAAWKRRLGHLSVHYGSYYCHLIIALQHPYFRSWM